METKTKNFSSHPPRPAPILRPISAFGLSSADKELLLENGFHYANDFDDLQPSRLAHTLGIDMERALAILSVIRPQIVMGQQKPVSALELWNKLQNSKTIVTFQLHLDELLGGGIAVGTLTEICGVPGIGKTQFGFQLACDVTIPEHFDGLGGECLYIDTEGSFATERLQQIAEGVVKTLHASAESEEDFLKLKNYSVELILSSIHYFRPTDYLELLALVHILPSILVENPRIKLIVLDSVAFHFRHDFDKDTRKQLSNLAHTLAYFAQKYELAVLFLNQMTTNVQTNSLVPALGAFWAQLIPTRILLYWSEGQRKAEVCKSSRKNGIITFSVESEGIR